jgi:hypothetical protein
MYALIDTLTSQIDIFNYHIYSDNIIIFAKKRNDDVMQSWCIAQLLQKCFLLQRNFNGQYGIFIRGCITQGNMFYDGKFVYGKGIIDAYNIENKWASYPRILIDNDIVDFIIQDGTLYNLIGKFIVKDEEDRYFIGYLNMTDRAYMCFAFYLKCHKKLVEAWLASDLPDEIREKYIWCKKYHNFVCKEYQVDYMIQDI